MFVTQVDSAGTFSFFGWGVGGLGAWDVMHMFAFFVIKPRCVCLSIFWEA